MSRSGYVEDGDYDDYRGAALYRGAVMSAIRGKRGQKLLRDLADALDAMPDKRLIADHLEADGEYCALGALACAKRIDVSSVDPEDQASVAKVFGVAESLIREIVYMNDECVPIYDFVPFEVCGPMRRYERHRTFVRVPVEDVDARRWIKVREWVNGLII